MSDTVENDFGLLKVQSLHLTGKVDKSVRFSCQIFSGLNIIKIVQFLKVIKKIIR